MFVNPRHKLTSHGDKQNKSNKGRYLINKSVWTRHLWSAGIGARSSGQAVGQEEQVSCSLSYNLAIKTILFS